MDAAARAELEALRRRAYGAAADIDTDPEAIARLTELEDAALRERVGETPVAPEKAPADTPRPDGRPVAVAPSPSSTAVITSGIPADRARPRGHAALVGAVGVAAITLGVLAGWNPVSDLAAPSPTPTPAATVTLLDPLLEAEISAVLEYTVNAETLMTLGLDGAFGTYVNYFGEAPDPASLGFPIPEPRWTSALGEYFGFDLWIGGSIRTGTATNPEPQTLCLVLMKPATNRSRCMEREAWDSGAMLLAVPYAELEETERPPTMTVDQSLGFWWTSEGELRVMLGPLD